MCWNGVFLIVKELSSVMLWYELKATYRPPQDFWELQNASWHTRSINMGLTLNNSDMN